MSNLRSIMNEQSLWSSQCARARVESSIVVNTNTWSVVVIPSDQARRIFAVTIF